MRAALITIALALVFTLPAVGKEAKASTFPVCITRNQVFSAIREALRQSPLEVLEFNADQLDIPEVRCASRSPQLKATSVTYDSKSGAIESRLQCAGRSCLPFYIRVTATQSSVPLASQSLRISEPNRVTKQHPSPILRVGDAATLSVATPAMRISLPVRCLQSGGIDDIVRVRDPQTNKVFVARIESKTRLALVGGLQ